MTLLDADSDRGVAAILVVVGGLEIAVQAMTAGTVRAVLWVQGVYDEQT